jgi:hypothetical protein
MLTHLLFQVEHLAEEIIKRIEHGEDPERHNAPDLTRDIFEIKAEWLQELLDKKEFDLVCDAVDKLVDEGRLHFDHSLGKLVINENVLPVDPDATSPGPHDDD